MQGQRSRAGKATTCDLNHRVAHRASGWPIRSCAPLHYIITDTQSPCASTMALSLRSARCTTGHQQPARPRTSVVSRVFDAPSNGSAGAIPDGAKVKVVKPIKVFHVPKHAELDLQGLEGTVQKNASQYKGKTLSANLPIVVKFETPAKFLAHLVSRPHCHASAHRAGHEAVCTPAQMAYSCALPRTAVAAARTGLQHLALSCVWVCWMDRRKTSWRLCSDKYMHIGILRGLMPAELQAHRG